MPTTDRRFTVSVCTRALCTYYPDSPTPSVGFAVGTKQGIRLSQMKMNLNGLELSR